MPPLCRVYIYIYILFRLISDRKPTKKRVLGWLPCAAPLHPASRPQKYRQTARKRSRQALASSKPRQAEILRPTPRPQVWSEQKEYGSDAAPNTSRPEGLQCTINGWARVLVRVKSSISVYSGTTKWISFGSEEWRFCRSGRQPMQVKFLDLENSVCSSASRTQQGMYPPCALM